MLRNVSGLSASSLAKAFRGLKDTSAAGQEAVRHGYFGAGKNLKLKAREVDKVIRRMITLGLIEEHIEKHEFRSAIAKLAVDERKLTELIAGGQGVLKVEITEIGKAGSADRATSPVAAVATINYGAGPSNAVAIAAAPSGKKKNAASKKRAKGTAAPAAVPAAAPVINLVSSSDEEEEEIDDEAKYFAQNPEAKLRFDVMITMLRQLSIVLKEHTQGKRIPLSTAVQQKLAKNPPSTPEEMKKITITGISNHMKNRFGPALLAGVSQADAHLVAVKAGTLTIEDFVLDKVTVLAGLDPGGGVNRSGHGVGGGLEPQQHFYPQPQKNSANLNATGFGNKRPRDEDLDWGDDSDDDDDDDNAWLGAAFDNAQPAALAPYHRQQQHYNNITSYTSAPPQAPRPTANIAAFPTTIAAGRPSDNTTKNNDAIPLAQRQKELKAKLQRDVAVQKNTNTTRAQVLPYNSIPGQVKSMAVKDINNAFG